MWWNSRFCPPLWRSSLSTWANQSNCALHHEGHPHSSRRFFDKQFGGIKYLLQLADLLYLLKRKYDWSTFVEHLVALSYLPPLHTTCTPVGLSWLGQLCWWGGARLVQAVCGKGSLLQEAGTGVCLPSIVMPSGEKSVAVQSCATPSHWGKRVHMLCASHYTVQDKVHPPTHLIQVLQEAS